eukprot:gene26508-35171_t
MIRKLASSLLIAAQVISVSMALRFASRSNRIMSSSFVLYAEELKNRQIFNPNATVPTGRFFAADVGVPASIFDYGSGDVGGNEYEDALFHPAPRGKNKPLITEDAVVKLPNMKTVYRGYSEARAVAAHKATPWITTPWTPEEDAKLAQLVDSDTGGRGKWGRVSKAMLRTSTDCSTRYMQVVNPKPEEPYGDILRDAEILSGLQGKGLPAEKYNWMNKGSTTYVAPHSTLKKE